MRKLSGMEYVAKATLQEWIDKTKQYREKIGDKAYKEEVAKEMKDLDEKYLVINLSLIHILRKVLLMYLM